MRHEKYLWGFNLKKSAEKMDCGSLMDKVPLSSGLLSVPGLNRNFRVLRGIDELVEAGCLTPFSAWLKIGHLNPAPETLDEADRCAGILVTF